MDEVYQAGVVYPPREKVFNAIQTTPLEAVKVVIIGQDPYHGPNQAQGLSFPFLRTFQLLRHCKIFSKN